MTEINHKDQADQTKQARDENGELIKAKLNRKQAGAELGQAQPEIGVWVGVGSWILK